MDPTTPPVTRNDYDDFLVDDTLFVGDLPSSVRETDIKTLLQHCMPLEMYIRREDDLIDNDEASYLRFSSQKYADRAYTIYHGFTFTNGATLKLRMYRNPDLEPEARGDILEITDLAAESDDVHRLYDIFRPFGPLQLCISNGQGIATIQYFNQADSVKAVYETNGMLLDGKRITITPLTMGSDYATTPGDTPPSLSPTPQISPQQQQVEDERKEQQQQQQHPEKQTPVKSNIDFTNLYVKNMDPLITNEHLQALFGKFGRIISARVISHPTTKQSRGYGFVSFSTKDEAAWALEEMNGQVVFSKPLYVSFHEPKKGRNDNNNINNSSINYNNSINIDYNNNSNSNSNINYSNNSNINYSNNSNSNNNNNNSGNIMDHSSYYHPQVNNMSEYQQDNMDPISYQQHIDPSPYQPLQHTTSPVINLPRKQDPALGQRFPSTPVIDERNLYQNNATIKLFKKNSPPPEEAVLIPLTPPSNLNGPSHAMTGLRNQQGHDMTMYRETQPLMDIVTMDYNKLVTVEPSSIRRRSKESVMTDKAVSLQHKKLTKAVIQCDACPKNRVPDVVDLLVTLTRKERSLCLFNANYLHDKVNLALESLDIFDDDEDDDDEDDDEINSTSDGGDYTNTNLWEPFVESSPLPRTTHMSVKYNPPKSNYLLPATPPTSSLSDLTAGPLSSNDIDTLLDSFVSMPLITQKQNLGDIMWPHVKPLVKPLAKKYRVPGFSSKILVYLLDNLPLSELAHGMNDPNWLKAQIEAAANTLYSS